MNHDAVRYLCPTTVHLLGFAGSALIIASITVRSVVCLRVIGLVGAATFIAYGAALGAWPVIVTNLVTSSNHLYQLQPRSKSEPAAT